MSMDREEFEHVLSRLRGMRFEDVMRLLSGSTDRDSRYYRKELQQASTLIGKLNEKLKAANDKVEEYEKLPEVAKYNLGRDLGILEEK